MSATALGSLLERLEANGIEAELSGDSDRSVDDVFHDDSQVTPGSLYCCVVGAHADGHDHAAAAVRAGAVALVTQRSLELGVPEIRVDDVRVAMGHLAAEVHDNPADAMRCIGVTGTNGKTTTVSLLAAVARAADLKVGVIGTLTGTRTTPEAADLQRQLARLRDEGTAMVAIEVSSHALVQHRVTGTRFAVSIFTNLSPDHLDYHGTMEEYFRAKAMLFEPNLSDRAVVNTDDPHGRLLADAPTIPTQGFGSADAEPVRSIAPIEFTWRCAPVRMALAGRFNIENALAAATAASVVGLDDEAIRRGLAHAEPVPGRFEFIETDQAYPVIVDFAHTPDGLRRALDAAREIAGVHRVLLAFGAGGDRDASKRPAMGAVADRGADVAVITSDNPRSEDPMAIADAITAGMHGLADVAVELDRRSAIASLLDDARPGDVVLIAGKGHESTQTIGDVVTSFDDRVVVRQLLAGRRPET